MHVPPEANAPAPPEDSDTLPDGELGIAAVSVTVTAHAVDAAIGNEEGTQLTAVVVVSGVSGITNNGVDPELAAVVASPA